MENRLPLGVLYPIQMGPEGHFETAYYNIDNEKTKLSNLMQTVEGERNMQPNFGLGIHKYLFDFIDELIVPKIEEEIYNKVSFWVPNVVIVNLNVDVQSGPDRNHIYVDITFALSTNPLVEDNVTFVY
jgi:phage baseplate assembly protein W